MMGYFAYFQFVKSEDFINSPYNKRQDLFARKVTRGEIISADGHILAETITDTDGTETRYYPYANMFAHVVGFSTNGKSGLESIANFNLLRSHTMTLEKVVNELQGEKNIGDNVVTTLNYDLQDTAYEALGKYDGAIVVMEPSTGKILAMVSKPDYDPNTLLTDWAALTDSANTQSQLLNRAAQGLYAPGSTFKIITAAAGLEERVVTTESTFSCPGFIIVDDRKIRCHKIGGHGTQTFVQCMQNSCNPALISVGLRLGVDNYYKYFEQFGLKKRTGIDLPGEAATIMHKKEDMGNVELATVAFGQSFQITAIQLLTTASSIINGGNRVTPHLGMEALNRDGEVEQVFTYPVETGIVSEETSATMRYILETVVAEGSGRNGQVQGFRVGGKTATSQTLPRGSGRYISSFIGFAPADDPQVIAIAIINNPQGVYYGGQVAAPIIRQLYENILPYLGLEKTEDTVVENH